MNKHTPTNRLLAIVFTCSFLLIIAKGLHGLFQFAWNHATPIVENLGIPLLIILLIFSTLKTIDGILKNILPCITPCSKQSQHYESFLIQRYQQLQTECLLLSQRKNQMFERTLNLPVVSPSIRRALLFHLQQVKKDAIRCQQLLQQLEKRIEQLEKEQVEDEIWALLKHLEQENAARERTFSLIEEFV